MYGLHKSPHNDTNTSMGVCVWIREQAFGFVEAKFPPKMNKVANERAICQ